MFVLGMRHLVRLLALSVRYHTSRFTEFVPELRSSIQSDRCPRSLVIPAALAARNSEIVTCSAAERPAEAKSDADRKQKNDFRMGVCLGFTGILHRPRPRARDFCGQGAGAYADCNIGGAIH